MRSSVTGYSAGMVYYEKIGRKIYVDVTPYFYRREDIVYI